MIKGSKIILNSLCYNIIFHYQNLSNRFMYNVTFEKKIKSKERKKRLIRYKIWMITLLIHSYWKSPRLRCIPNNQAIFQKNHTIAVRMKQLIGRNFPIDSLLFSCYKVFDGKTYLFVHELICIDNGIVLQIKHMNAMFKIHKRLIPFLYWNN